MSLECEHGQLARSCNLCEYEREIAELRARVAELKAALRRETNEYIEASHTLVIERDEARGQIRELEAENQRLWMMNPCNHTGFESAPCDVCGYPDPRKLIAKLEAENISYQNENAAQRREIERIKKVLELGCQDSESVCPYWINMKDFEKENEHLEEESHRLWDEFL